ncbi:MAG TPA: hypothetical protein PLM69_11945, partial [Syntrophales bacterium]|nr:hypothetical protein [Syntrophales bacterium]
MALFLLGLAVLFAGGLASLLCGRKPGAADGIGAAGAVAGGVLAAVPAFRILLGAPAASLQWNWNIPYGSFFIQIDSLSAFFLIPVIGLSVIAAVYGFDYLRAYRDRKNLGVAWFFYNLLLIGMMLVVVARNGVLFLIAWETMSLASFFLVTFE